MREMAAHAGEDPFRRLPDDLLRHVLSFLPDDDALQTCVLDTRWRDLWRHTTSLYCCFSECGSEIEMRMRFKQIVNLIIQLRGNKPLVKCKIISYHDEKDVEQVINSYPDEEDVKQLINYALMCQVKELIVRSDDTDEDPLPCDASFISHHLKILELFNVDFQGSSLDFSNCLVLEDLKMDRCRIIAPNISSKSLKRLCITGPSTLPMDFHIQIVAPGLISLQLDDFVGLTPSLGCMPFLLTAYVRLDSYCHDFCIRNGQGCTRRDCGCHAYPVDEGVLLNGLSNAVSLELIAESEVFIYKWDLKRCPIFNKLKSLLLNEWFKDIDLVCILQHSPVLEMLTLQLGNTKNIIGAMGAEEAIEQSFVCAHLKIVNIECEEIDEAVHTILTILRTCGILRDHISIEGTSAPSYFFSFQKAAAFASTEARTLAASTTDGN